jgi:hypothetical protein
MAFTYDDNPAGIPRDQVRFLIGDTDPENPWFSDAEVAYLLSSADSDPRAAAIAGVQGILARIASWQDETVGGVTLKISDLRDAFTSLLARLQTDTGTGALGAPPYVGGVDVADKQDLALDPTRIPTQYSTRMFMTRGSSRSRPRSELLGDDDL